MSIPKKSTKVIFQCCGLREVIRLFLWTLFAAFCFSANAYGVGCPDQSTSAPEFKFTVRMEDQFLLAEAIPLTLFLTNCGEETKQIIPLDKAAIRFTWEQLPPSSAQVLDKAERTIGGARRQAVQYGQTILWGAIELPKEAFKPGETQELQLDLVKVFGDRRLGPGKYKLLIKHSDLALTIEHRFRVAIDDDETVPDLIRMIEEAPPEDFEARSRAAYWLRQFTGQRDWIPSRNDTPEKIKEEVQKLRSWWEGNKVQIQQQIHVKNLEKIIPKVPVLADDYALEQMRKAAETKRLDAALLLVKALAFNLDPAGAKEGADVAQLIPAIQVLKDHFGEEVAPLLYAQALASEQKWFRDRIALAVRRILSRGTQQEMETVFSRDLASRNPIMKDFAQSLSVGLPTDQLQLSLASAESSAQGKKKE